MTFQEALSQMKIGKKIKLTDQDYHLSIIGKIYYDSNADRPTEILSVDNHILRNDWEVIE